MANSSRLRRYLPLVRSLVRREIRQRYKASALGLLWTLINPLVVVAAYWFIFRFVFPTTSNDPYALFLFVGLSVWTVFLGGAQAAASSLVANANLVTKVNFPRQIIPLSAMAGAWFTGLVMFVISAIFCAIVGHGRLVTWLALPPLFVLLLMLTVGFGLFLAAVNVYLRDVEHILAAVALPWFFLTPILFSLDAVPSGEEWAVDVLHYGNFVTPFVLSIRGVLFDGVWPATSDVMYCATAATLMLGLGLVVFRSLQSEMAVEL